MTKGSLDLFVENEFLPAPVDGTKQQRLVESSAGDSSSEQE